MIYSIGYGGRQPSELIELLRKYNIELLIDVRRKAKCTWNQFYSEPKIANFFSDYEIGYIHKPELGGFKKRDETYFKALEWLFNMPKIAAIMCCERHYFFCHRYQKIGNDLAKIGFQIKHITSNGGIYIHPVHAAASSKLSSL